jgi:hypothetical protein
LAADWIVEGEVVSKLRGERTLKEVGPGRRPDGTSVREVVKDIEIWDGGKVQLTNVLVIKGVVPSARHGMTVQADSPCWIGQTYVYEGQVGRRILVYGSDFQWIHGFQPEGAVAIFAVREIDARGNLVRY